MSRVVLQMRDRAGGLSTVAIRSVQGDLEMVLLTREDEAASER